MYQYTEEDMYWAFKEGQQWHKDLTDGENPKPFPDSMADKFPNKFRQAAVSGSLPPDIIDLLKRLKSAVNHEEFIEEIEQVVGTDH